MVEARPVSIIVLTWNGLAVTRRCIESLRATEHPDWELITVDNGSTDGTLDYLRGLDSVRLIENGENLGFVRGNNAGIAAAAPRDVVLLNNDTEITQADWLARLQALAYSDEHIGLVGCRLVNGDGMLVHAGTYMPIPSFWGQEYPGKERDIGQYARDREVEGVIAACEYIKREVIDRIGALDEDYFSYYEDTDYCLKAREAGYRVWCCGGVTVKHLENASTDVNRMDFSATFRRSRDTFLSKWKPHYDAFYRHELTWHSFVSGEDRFSLASRRFLWALDRAAVDCNLAFLEGVEKAEMDDFRVNDMKNRGADRRRPQVLFGPPDMLDRADGSYNIGYVSTPYDRFPDEWVRGMNRMDEIWVPSPWQAQAARESGLKGEPQVIPHGVGADYFHPSIAAWPLSDRFTFLAHFDWGSAVAAQTLLRAFTDEFAAGDGAVLVMVVTSPAPGAVVEQEVEAMNLPLERAPVVFVVDNEIPDYQAGALYRSADCVVMPQRAADDVTVQQRALACGVPVITTEWGSAAAIVDGQAVRGIACSTAPSERNGCAWAEPDGASLRAALRAMFDDAAPAREAAQQGAREIARDLDWDTVAAMMVGRLDGIH